jgi:hypothetical protein
MSHPADPADSPIDSLAAAPDSWRAGDRVRVVALPPYVKTAAPMPMLRSPNVISLGEIGTLLARQPGHTWSVRFATAAYLLENQYLEKIPPES